MQRQPRISQLVTGLLTSAFVAIAFRGVAAEEPSSKPIAASLVSVLVADRSSEKDLAIQKSLQTRISFDFEQTELSEVINVLQKKVGVQIELDEPKIQDEGVATDQPITAWGNDVLLEAVLDRILDPLQLTWLIRYETLQVTTTVAAGEILETRVYGVQEFLDTGYDYDELIDLLSSTVEPESWDEVGGPSSMRPGVGVLVIRQTQRFHRKIANVLGDLKHIADVQRQLAGDGRKPESVVRIYRTGGVSATQLAKAIEATIEPETWESKGGAGRIFPLSGNAVLRSGYDTTGGTKNVPQDSSVSSEAILITQSNRVHARVRRLLVDLKSTPFQGFICATPIPSSKTPQQDDSQKGDKANANPVEKASNGKGD